MKKVIYSILFLFPTAAFAQSTETRNVDAFTGVSTSALVSVELKSGSPCSVMLEGETESMAAITTEVKDGMLIIGQKGNGKSGPVTVFVTISDLKKLDISGPSELRGTGTIVTDSLRIEGGGGSELELSVTARTVNVDLSGASSMRLCGTTDRLDVSVSGAAELSSGCLESQTVNIETSGASSASVSAGTSLVARSSGVSEIVVYGEAKDRSVESSGTSSIEIEGGSGASDTTRVRIGGRDVSIVNDPDEMSNREKKAVDDDFEFWGGVDLGVNGLMTYDNQVVMPQGLESMDLNYVKSYVFGVNMFQKNIHIYRNNVNLGTGLGLTWYHYNLRGSYSLQPNVDYTFAVNDSLDYSKNRLNMCYVNVPLFLEFNTNSSNADRSFHIGGGVQFGYNIFKNKLKQKYELDNRTYKRKVKDDFNINPFKIDLIGRMGFGDFTIFASYSLTTLFEKQKGPTLYPFTAGIHIDF